MDIPVIYQHTELIVVDKPAGWLTVPAREADDPRPVLGLHLQQVLGRQVYPVHRLDEPVSGLVLFALSADAHRAANAWFEHHRVRKTYRAWTSPQDFGHIPDTVLQPREPIALTAGLRIAWQGNLKRGKRRAFQHRDGKPTHTEAIYLGQRDRETLRWDLEPVTGRPHQLRVDLARHGFPVIGDALYGSTRPFHVAGAIALTAWRLDFSGIAADKRWGLPPVLEIPVAWEK